ncbi:MAG: GGDEF domain-containing protein [Oscillospiraceae bacterium]|nr:GGDEF domain-containing protein [Oscillospiraceae bacterium]
MFKGRRVLAVCIPKVYDAASFRYVSKLNEFAVKKGYLLFVYQTCSDLYNNSRSDIGETYVYDLLDYDIIDGIVMFTEMIKDKSIPPKIAANAAQNGIPVVSVERYIEGCINISYDYGNCFEQIVRHIIVDHKLTKVNFIAGFKDNEFSEERLNVYKRVLEEQGIPYDPERVGYGDFWDYPTRAVMEKFLADGKELPEAIICCNDVMAMTACKCLLEKGYSVPDDVIVSGFDGIEDEQYHSPRLTTCRNSFDKLSERAVEFLDLAINGEPVPDKAIIDFEMVVSQSCGCVEQKVEAASYMITELHERLNGEMQRAEIMASITTTISSAHTAETLNNFFSNKMDLYGIYCCLNTDALNPKSGIVEFESDVPFTDEMDLVYFGSYDRPIKGLVRFERSEVAPRIEEMFLEAKLPIVFAAIHYLDIPLGYLCMCFPIEAIHYDRIPQVAEAFGNGFGNRRMFTAMEKLYTHDTLTELYNRRGFYQLAVPKFEKAAADKKSAVVISADLDGLKTINDTYGHAEGDIAIKVVGRALENASLNDEVCARFGGDEFAVAAVADNANEFAENFKKRFYEYIDNYNKTSGKPYKISSSIGIAGDYADKTTVDILMKISDDLMYTDKASRKKVRSRPR